MAFIETTEAFNPEVHVHLLLDGWRGAYLPQVFCEQYCPTKEATKALGVGLWPVETCLAGPDGEHYYDAWNEIIRDATLKHDGYEWFLWQNDDLFMIRRDVEVPEDYWYF